MEKPKILCLHGFRTSGLILSRQMAAMKFHVNADFSFMNAPHPATGEPDEGIQTYYPNMSYYEWNSSTGNKRSLSESTSAVLEVMRNKGPFDGILGFSQGACMATHLALLKQNDDNHVLNTIKFVILIGGVPPSIDNDNGDDDGQLIHDKPITLPSLHVWGEEDFVLDSSKRLKSEWYDPSSSREVIHSGGHHIPTLRSGLYSVMNDWILEQL